MYGIAALLTFIGTVIFAAYTMDLEQSERVDETVAVLIVAVLALCAAVLWPFTWAVGLTAAVIKLLN